MTCPLQSPFASFGLVLMENIYLMLKSRFNCSAAAQTHRQVPLSRFEWGYISPICLQGALLVIFFSTQRIKSSEVQYSIYRMQQENKRKAEQRHSYSFLSSQSTAYYMFLLNFLKVHYLLSVCKGCHTKEQPCPCALCTEIA